ncbi:MAG: IS30 family transposase [Polaromonas sp.]
MGKSYEHLGVGERALIQAKLESGCGVREISRSLGRAPSTISRELKRCGWQAHKGVPRARLRARGINGYWCEAAHQRACTLASKPRAARKLVPGNALWQRVLAALKQDLSPQQVSDTLARMEPAQRISHETIYTALYAMPKGELRAEVLGLLRQHRKARRSRAGGQDRRPLIIGMTSIEERPVSVEDRLVPGHWEGDLIKGAHNKSQVGTLVERKTLFTMLVQLDSATAYCTANGFAKVLKRVDAQMRLSLTYDQGREMAHHAHLQRQTGMQVYFAHPHSPWERGINENTNGLLRQYLPKGSDLSIYSQERLDEIAHRLNARPRRSLGGRCPAELFLPDGAFDFKAYWADKLKPVALGA